MKKLEWNICTFKTKVYLIILDMLEKNKFFTKYYLAMVQAIAFRRIHYYLLLKAHKPGQLGHQTNDTGQAISHRYDQDYDLRSEVSVSSPRHDPLNNTASFWNISKLNL